MEIKRLFSIAARLEADYMTDAYLKLDLPVAPAILVGVTLLPSGRIFVERCGSRHLTPSWASRTIS